MRRVLILGGGAAGYSAAQQLIPALRGRADVTLSLLEERSHCIVRPLLSEVAAGALAPQLALAELGRLSDFGPIAIHTARLLSIDPSAGEVTTDRGVHPFDYLLLALDGEPSLPEHWAGPEGPRRLQTDLDAAALRNRLRQLWKERPEHPPSVVVIGGGPVGVDLAAWLAGPEPEPEPGQPAPPRTASCRVTVVERQGRLLPDFPDEFSAYAAEVLAELGVRVHTDTHVVEGRGQEVLLDGGAVEPADLVVWAGGERPIAPVRELAQRVLDSRDLVCDRFLRLEGFPNIVVAGAHATSVGAGTTARNLAFEVRSGRLAASNLLAAMAGRAPTALTTTPPMLATPMGRGRAIAMVLGFVVRGRTAWPLYRLELARLLPRMSNRLNLLGAWASEALLGSRPFMPR
jgi:NADH:ubiquinone reductase (H+-translocating)